VSPGDRILIGLCGFVLGVALLWFGYSNDVVAERNRREFIEGTLSRAASEAGDPGRFREALRAVLVDLESADTGLSEEIKVDGRFTALTLMEDAGSTDSTAARVELLRFVSRVEAVEPRPERWVGRAGLVLLAAGLCVVGTGIRRRKRAEPRTEAGGK
jgi:hypothetical protein